VLFDAITDWAWVKDANGVRVNPPKIGQGVWVQFEGGDPSFPVLTGTFGDNTNTVNLALDELTDVNTAGVTNNQVLRYNTATGTWVNGTISGTSLDGLTDVTITTPLNNQTIKYDTATGTWVNVTVSNSSLDGLTDVTITSPLAGQTIKYDTATNSWINGVVSGVPAGGTAGQILTKSSSTDYDAGWTDNYADWTSQVKQYVRAGEILTKGQAVYVSSSDGTNIMVSKASNTTEALSSKTIGLIAQALNTTSNKYGYVITEGLLGGLNTSSGEEGDPVWLGVSGALIYGLASKPVAPAHLVYIGVITKKSAGSGEIFIKPQNGFELQELHNVLIGSGYSSTPTNKDILQYESASSLWKNVSFPGTITGAIYTSTVAPTVDIKAGDHWLDPDTGNLFVYYADGTSSQWVQTSSGLSGGTDIRGRVGSLESRTTDVETLNTTQNGRLTAVESLNTTQDSRLTAVEGVNTTQNGRLTSLEGYTQQSPNYIINGGFDIWQRGTSSTTSSAFIADRWLHSWSAGTATVSRSTDVPETTFQYSLSFASTSGTNPQIQNRIEAANATALVGQTVTYSIWAKSTVGTAGLSWSTRYPTTTADTFSAVTAGESGVFAASMTVGTWTRYSVTFTVPADAVRGYSFLVFRNVTTTSTTTLYAGAQLELGSFTTPFRRNAPSIQAELAACQRYYANITSGVLTGLYVGYAFSTTQGLFNAQFIVPMRTGPVLVLSAVADFTTASTNGTPLTLATLVLNSTSNTTCRLGFTVASGLSGGQAAPLLMGSSSSVLAFNAEL
jgi:hypothetical protein